VYIIVQPKTVDMSVLQLYIFLLLILSPRVVFSSVETLEDYFGTDDIFPTDIIPFRVRKDFYTNETVSKGKIQLLGGLNNPKEFKKIPYSEFHRLLQCPRAEDFDGLRGSMSLLKMLPPTKKSLMLMIVYIKTHCSPWRICHEKLANIINSEKDPNWEDPDNYGNGIIYRLIKGELYRDYPWRSKIYDMHVSTNFIHEDLRQVQKVIGRISDLKDSAFLMGYEHPLLPQYIPMPVFSCSSSAHNFDMLLPWSESFDNAQDQQVLEPEPKEFESFDVWINRKPLAGWMGSMSLARRIIVDVAKLYPDLFFVQWKGAHGNVIRESFY